jgi:hypothetical protein
MHTVCVYVCVCVVQHMMVTIGRITFVVVVVVVVVVVLLYCIYSSSSSCSGLIYILTIVVQVFL